MPDRHANNEADDAAQALEEACARNAPLELHTLDYDRGTPCARARMIELGEAQIYLERPQIIGRNVRLCAGQEFEAFFSFGDVLFTFRTRVIEASATVRLNNLKLVEGLVVSRPARVCSGQRRQFYRTSLAATREPVSAQIQEASDRDDEPRPDDRGLWTDATVVDASAGGFGVRVEESNYSRFKIYHNYFVRFTVPESGKDVTALCELRQVRPILGGEATKLGFLVLPWPTQGRVHWEMQPLLAYLTKLQRSRLAG